MIPRTPPGGPNRSRGVEALFSNTHPPTRPAPSSTTPPPSPPSPAHENIMQVPIAGVHTAAKDLLRFVPPNALPQANSSIDRLNKAITDLTTAMTTQSSQISTLHNELSTLREEREKALADVRAAKSIATKASKGLKAMEDGFPEWLTLNIHSVITENLSKELPSHLDSFLHEARQQLEQDIYTHAKDTSAIYNALTKDTRTSFQDMDRRVDDLQQQMDTIRTLINELPPPTNASTNHPPSTPPRLPPPPPVTALNEELLDRPNQDANTNKLVFRVCSQKPARTPADTVELTRNAIRSSFNVDAVDLLPMGQPRTMRLWDGSQGHAQLVEARFPANTNATAFMRHGRELLCWCTDHAPVTGMGLFRIYMDCKLTPWQSKARAAQAGLMRDLQHQFRNHRANIGIYWQGHRIKVTLRCPQPRRSHQPRPPTNIFPANTNRTTILSWISDNAPNDFQVPPVPPTPARPSHPANH